MAWLWVNLESFYDRRPQTPGERSRLIPLDIPEIVQYPWGAPENIQNSLYLLVTQPTHRNALPELSLRAHSLSLA